MNTKFLILTALVAGSTAFCSQTPLAQPLSGTHRGSPVQMIDLEEKNDTFNQNLFATMLEEVNHLKKERANLQHKLKEINNVMSDITEKQREAAAYDGKTEEKKLLKIEYQKLQEQCRPIRSALYDFDQSYKSKITQLFALYHDLNTESIIRILEIPEELRMLYSTTHQAVQAKHERKQLQTASLDQNAGVKDLPAKQKTQAARQSFNPEILQASTNELFYTLSGIKK